MNLKGIFNKIRTVIKNRRRKIFKTKFEKRIIKRNRIFWETANDLDRIKINLPASTPMGEWTNIENWQRRLENKYNEKQFALKFGCKVAELYWFGGKDEFKDFDLYTLPVNYIIKPNIGHSAKNTFVMKNGVNLFTNKRYTKDELNEKIKMLFEQQPDLELLIEEFIISEEGNLKIPIDYKFYMFNGEVAFTMVIKRGPGQKERTYYDEQWKLLDKKVCVKEKGYPSVPPPKDYDIMLKNARTLSKVYGVFVRIDFYSSPEGPVFGEFTPTPDEGQLHTKYGSNLLIHYWDKYCTGKI